MRRAPGGLRAPGSGFRAPVFVVAAVAATLAGGCGYGFASTGAPLPDGVGAVHVPVLENRSPEPEAGAIFAEALAASLAARGHGGDETAGARIRGVVLDVSSAPIATGPEGTGAGVYRVWAKLRLSLERGGRVLCTREVGGGEDYLPARDILGLEAGRRAALRRLATSLMAEAPATLCPFAP